jgi:chemotaxis protein MotA
MDIATLIGIIIGLSAIIGGQMLESGAAISIIHPTAAIIVFGGTLGAIMINFPMKTIINAIFSLKKVFLSDKIDLRNVFIQIINLADLTRREGNLALEPVVNTIDNDFLRKGVQLIADSANARVIKDILGTQIKQEEEEAAYSALVFESAGGFAPTFGIVGAVLGLIQVMQHISEPSMLGQGIATAFIATFYGVAAANLILLPLGGKIRIKINEEIAIKQMILEGVLSIHSGENPAVVEEKLNSFLIHKYQYSQPQEIMEPEGW